MKNFQEYQALAAQVPVSLRNNRDRLQFPVAVLRESAGEIGSLRERAFATDKLSLTEKQQQGLQDRLSDILWSSARLCDEGGISLQNVAEHSLALLQARAKDMDPDRR